MAAYRTMLDKGYSKEESAKWVLNYLGTPNYRAQGTWTPTTNTIFMYSNMTIQDYSRSARLAMNPKTAAGWWVKSTFSEYLPTILMAMASAGIMGALLKEMFDRIPENMKTRYICIPLYINDADETVFVAIPHSGGPGMVAMMLWKALQGKNAIKTATDIIDVNYSQGFNLHPGLEVPKKTIEFAAGGNPVDSFYGRPIVEQYTNQPARESNTPGAWIPAAKDMLEWNTKQFGMFSNLAYGQLGPLTGNLIRKSRRGLEEQQWNEIEVEDADKAAWRALNIPDSARQLVREHSHLQRRAKTLEGGERIRYRQLSEFYKQYGDLREEGMEHMGDEDRVLRVKAKMDRLAQRYELE
jgi:hypothetical protein